MMRISSDGFSTVQTSALTIWSIVISPSRRADSRVEGIRSSSQ